jgi:DNA-binding PadR family transcriptional regulator
MGGPGRRGRRGHVRSAILALLADEPSNGYQIMQTLAQRTQGMWKPSPGAVYPALSQMEDEGLIESFDNQGQRAFRLTEAGRQAAASVETPPWEMVNEAVAGWGPDQVKELWREFTTLAGPIKELTRTANAGQLEAATRLLADTRRKLYGLLATEDAGSQDVHNGDDLR